MTKVAIAAGTGATAMMIATKIVTKIAMKIAMTAAMMGDGYRQQRHYDEPIYRQTRVWRGDDGRAYCRRSDGTTGLLIGGAAGALLGREVAGRYGDRTMGAILGAAGGALIGRSIDRNNARCR